MKTIDMKQRVNTTLFSNYEFNYQRPVFQQQTTFKNSFHTVQKLSQEDSPYFQKRNKIKKITQQFTQQRSLHHAKSANHLTQTNKIKNTKSVRNLFGKSTLSSENRMTQQTKISEKLFTIQQKIHDMKLQLLKKKQQKQLLIQRQLQQRQRRHMQRQNKKSNKLNKKHQKKQKSNQQKALKSNQNLFLHFSDEQIESPSILQQKQSSIIQDAVTQMPQPKGIHHHFSQNPYSPRNTIYYVSQIVKAYKDEKSLARQHIIQSLQILRVLENSRMPSFQQIKQKKLNLPQKNQYKNKKVLVFDLDETLIHCNDSLSKQYHVKITITFPNGSSMDAGVNIRPYAREILRNLYKQFQIIIFTASQSCYADEVLNILDPNGQYISHRLYREHCFLSPQGMYIKDLRIINRPLSDMVLIDNAAYSYFFQLQNGIPIIPYYHGSVDFELKALQKYLIQLKNEKDVRKLNRKTFLLHRYVQYLNMPNKMVEELYIKQI